ncbi:MAG: hypothetical protein A2Y38_15595 [Spirochaetes bacterium GWB1_59_5]|nr:MAG: hypothetical protein A2Y38_15595 [Spirochaetes bacterium GWB1_59_5]
MDAAERQPVEGEYTQAAPDPIVAKAAAAGWRPLEEFDGDPEHWVDAKEFVKRAPLYEKNHKLKRELTEMKATIHELKGHIGKVSEAAYNKAVKDLQAQRDEAIDIGDRDQVKELDKAIKEAETLKPSQPDVHPAIAAWEKVNKEWFYADPEITDFGMSRAQAHLRKHPEDFEGAMEVMEAACKREFPGKCGDEKKSERKPAPPAVEGGSSPGAKRTFGESDLTDEQRKVMSRFVRQGVMSKEEYIKDLAESGLLGGKK